MRRLACSGESFVGPDGTAATFFSEAGRTEPALAAFDLSGVPPAPYLQVTVTLQRANAGVDPELVDVIVVP